MVFENKIIWQIDIHKTIFLIIVLLLLIRGEVKVNEYLDIQQEAVTLEARRLSIEETKTYVPRPAEDVEYASETNHILPLRVKEFGDINLTGEEAE